MSAPELTLEQQIACDFKRNLYVCAGAGSGKTEVLTRRVIHILKQRQLELSRILVLTFTDKAAGQLRSRVYQAIQQQIHLKDKHQPYWLKLKENFYSNYISTFHACCASILREYALEAQLDPDFYILSGPEQQDLLAQVVNREIDRLAAHPQASVALTKLNLMWRRDAIVSKLIDIIKARSQTETWLAEFPSLSLTQYMARMDAYRCRAITEQIGNLCKSALFWEHLDTIFNLRQADNKTRTETERLVNILSIYPQLKKLSQLPPDPGLEILARLHEQLGLRGIKQPELKQALKGLRDLLAESQIFDYTVNPALEAKGYELLSALASLAQQCLCAYQKQKQNNAGLDFEDLQLMTLKLFQDGQHPHIRSELRQRFRYIMVDEFQDTNPLQWRIIKILAADDHGLQKDKLFMVGDEKQSIYAFRGADVTVFAQARAELRQANLKHNTHRLPFELPDKYAADYAQLAAVECNRLLAGEVVLKHNFRSAEGIMDFLNPFFQNLFQRRHYRPYDAQPQAQTAKRQFPGAKVELMLVEKGSSDSTNQEERLDDYIKEAHLIARRIKHILKAKPAAYSRVLEKLGNGEPAIAILLARRNKIKIYEEALRREKIDFLVSKGRGFYQRREIMDIVNVLKFINQPQPDISLAGVLRSPLIGLSDEGLLALTSLTGNCLWDKLCSLFSAGTPTNWPPGFIAADIQVLPQAFHLLYGWIALKDRLPLSELIIKILNDSQFYICLAKSPRGAQNLANLEKFIELARNFEAGGRGGIWEWVCFLGERLRDSEEGEAEVEPALGGAVQLMTIHQAKGLEFPLVFVPDLSNPFFGKQGGGLSGDKLSDGELYRYELGIKAPDPNDRFKPQATLMRKIIANIQQQKDLAERRRLLYVAATRAQDQLVLVGQIRHKAALPPLRASCWQDWIRDILAIDSLSQSQSASISNLQGKQVNIPITWFDPNEEIDLYHEPSTINLEEIDLQLEQLPPSAELDNIINKLTPRQVRERPVFSPSSLLEYRHCPRRFYGRHRLRIPAWGGQSSRRESASKEGAPPKLAALRGTIVHSLMEDGVFEDAYIQSRINKLLPEDISTGQRQSLSQNIKRHLVNILNSQGYRHWSRLPQSYQELKFKLRLGDFYLEGIIDQLHFDYQKNEWIIVDYKTNELDDVAELNELIETEGYVFQLKCYCWAAGQLLNQPVAGAKLFFSHFPHSKEFRFTPVTLDELQAEVIRLGHHIMAQKFDPLPPAEKQCKNCNYQQTDFCNLSIINEESCQTVPSEYDP